MGNQKGFQAHSPAEKFLLVPAYPPGRVGGIFSHPSTQENPRAKARRRYFIPLHPQRVLRLVFWSPEFELRIAGCVCTHRVSSSEPTRLMQRMHNAAPAHLRRWAAA